MTDRQFPPPPQQPPAEGARSALGTDAPAPSPASPPTVPPADTPSPLAGVVRDYGDIAGEYAALRASSGSAQGGAIVVDRSHRSRGTFAGAQAREVLTGLVTNDVLAIAPGDGCYAAALTAKGKILADLRIFVQSDDVLVDVPPRAAAGWWAMIRKYVNPRLARYADVSSSSADISVYGTRAHAVVATALALPWEELARMGDYAHRTVEAFGTAVLVARVPDLGIEGFSLILPIEAKPAAWHALVAAGARPAGLDAFEIARIESGRPEWGIEIDDSTLAQEANMESLQAISFTKGCYTGQETVARIHFRGHVNRHLRGLRFDDANAIPASAALHDATGKAVGDVRSAVVSPRLGGIALAMVRREVEADSDVEVTWSGGRATARVVSLPFPVG